MSFNSVRKTLGFELSIYGFSDQKIQVSFSRETDEHLQVQLINDLLGNITRFLAQNLELPIGSLYIYFDVS